MLRKLAFTFVLALLAATSVPAGAVPEHANPQGFMEVPFGVGYFYGTFDQDPNVILVAGAPAEAFCEAAERNPDVDDPFEASPGITTARMVLGDEGPVEFKVNDKEQPIYLYSSTEGDAPIWINGVCDGDIERNLFATGTAALKVRIGIDGNIVDVFNSVNGKATGTDGTEYKVRASADLVVIDGELQGNPADFVQLEFREIKRR